MPEIKQRAEIIKDSLEEIKKSLDIKKKKIELKELEAQSLDPDFWNDQEKARSVMQKIGSLRDLIDKLESFENEVLILLDLVKESKDDEIFEKDISSLEERLKELKLASFLSGKYDSGNAIVSIHAGQGGTEAMDWASMLYRMYLRYAERKNFKVETLDLTEGEEAGIKSVTFKVVGSYAYGYLKGESGTHRLVRQSPFNADRLRQTSFALVGVLPEIGDVDESYINLKDEDLEWQFFRSSSQGGQNVQKVSTAVRVKHIPTGIVVSCQTQRFQEQNRKIALELLRAKVWALEEERKSKEVKEIKGEYRPASWGNQIRSYVLHPYKMVKDLRTDVETSNTEAVLNGEIDEFIEAEILSLAT
ncbi:MAG: Peptide chain release factor 2 [Candidatus Woesebacteria bacterium]|jgi:peptide chain release factor 2|nr:MAG: Peptide chain release factor 2 [Candidatus Woesebacteria bacterium]